MSATPAKAAVVAAIRAAFGPNPYPGDEWLQGSFEGCEPEEEVGPFRGRTDWAAIDARELDAHPNALSFFSEAGFRFFLPAYLLADLDDRLATADPLFQLTHGFHDATVELEDDDGPVTLAIGGSVLLNPRRYGATTFRDHARWRLSVFTREESAAIVAYLRWKRASDVDGLAAPAIDAALAAYWLDRARSAPSADDLRRHDEDVARRSR